MSKKNKILRKICSVIGRNYPTSWMKLRYFLRYKKPLNLKNPKTLNEKILYLSLTKDNPLWTELSDKYKVREYVKEKIGEDKLVKLYGKWTNANDIDFDKLPDKFVLKTNHGSGEIKIVKDKSKLDIPATIKYFNEEIRRPYGELEGGRHYWGIKPLIIAEELLENDPETLKYSNSLIDYKCWCFNGKCQFVWVCKNRTKDGTEVMTYDLDWNPHPEWSIFTSHYRKGTPIPKPGNLHEIIQIAEKLSKPFPVVRVDLYSVNNKIYFGEMTFTSLGGLMNFFTKEFLEMSGNMIDLNYNG